MKNNLDPKEQLKELLKRYPEELWENGIYIEVFGTVLDYISRVNQSLEDFLLEFPNLYKPLFENEDNYQKTYNLLTTILFDFEKRKEARCACQKNGWSSVEKIIDEIDKEQSNIGHPDSSSAVDIFAGHKVEGVIWQLSDIHFGDMNLMGLSPRELVDTLCLIVNETPEFEPRLIIISGDLTSRAAEDEFKKLEIFCEYLSDELWGEHRPQRFLVVPGNHDTTWLGGGKADKLSNFNKYLSNSEKVITPFWKGPKKNSDSDGDVTITRFDMDKHPNVPPFVLVRDKRLNLQFLLLVSSYYSGFVPEKVRHAIMGIKPNKDRKVLQELLREDKGEISRDYLVHLKNSIKPVNRPTIAITHHHLDHYGTNACESKNARNLLFACAEKGIWLILHGHTHLEEAFDSQRVPNLNEAYPIPCPTLCSDTEPGNMWGFMIHLIGHSMEPRRITTAVWRTDESKFFKKNPDRLHIRYKFLLHKDKIKLIK